VRTTAKQDTDSMIHPRLRRVGAWGAFLAIAALTRIAVALDATTAKSAEQPAVGTSCQPALFKVAVDIGHYRASPGAISATGVTEFEYNLSLAHAVIAALQQAGFSAAFLIGESGTPLPPEDRSRIAKDAGAVLFLSLHHDSVQSRYLSEWTVNGRGRHYSDVFHGYSLFISGKNRREQESKQFATLLGEALLGEGLTPSLHHAEKIHGENRPLLDARLGLYRFDALEVLKTAPMPAALLESGIIVNRKEEQEIRNGSYHKLVVAAVVKAIRGFCSMYDAKR
jgi:N-acetylmuramoyl-L-alanine amidase